jgi:putative MATE family efflux protein
MKNNSMLEGNIWKTMFKLSWPTMIGMIFHTAFNVIDTIFVGRISAEAIAAVSIAFPFIFFFFAFAQGVGTGTTSLIARSLGAKDKETAQRAAKHSLLIGVVFWVIFGMLGFFLASSLFPFFGANETIMPMAKSYTYMIFSGFIFTFLFFSASSIFRGFGDMKTPMYVMIFSVVVNIVLDAILIFGWGFIPRMEVFGAALATVIARAVSCVVILSLLFSKKSKLKINTHSFTFDWKIIKDIFKVGIPSSLNMIVMSLGAMFYTKMASLVSPLAIAMYGIVSKLESIAFLPVIGISVATVTLVGHNFGAKNFKRIKEIAVKSSIISFIFMSIMGFIFWFFPEFWISIFSNNPEVLSLGRDYIKIIFWSFGFVGLGIIIGSLFQGLGRGTPTLMITLTRALAGLPVAIVLWFVMGINGVWVGSVISILVGAVVGFIWLKLSFKKLMVY